MGGSLDIIIKFYVAEILLCIYRNLSLVFISQFLHYLVELLVTLLFKVINKVTGSPWKQLTFFYDTTQPKRPGPFRQNGTAPAVLWDKFERLLENLGTMIIESGIGGV